MEKNFEEHEKKFIKNSEKGEFVEIEGTDMVTFRDDYEFESAIKNYTKQNDISYNEFLNYFKNKYNHIDSVELFILSAENI